jgi:anti-sigma B factor antagonist
MAGLDDGTPAQVAIDTRADAAGVPVISVAGDLDMSNAAALERAVAAATAKRPGRLVFDLTALRFMDSAGIAVLLGAAAKVDAVHLRNPTLAVRRVVELTGLTDVLTIDT